MSADELHLHGDFAGIEVEPGRMSVDADHRSKFDILNLLALGGEHDRRPHVPETVGRLGDIVLWESTGSSVSLPFWNTNFTDDVYLFLVHGRVHIEFKEVESDVRLGTYEGRTGDLMRLPRAIAHRTYSTDGRRRISLEVLRANPLWDRIGEHADVQPATRLQLGNLGFEVGSDAVGLMTPSGQTWTPRAELLRGLRALIAYELHLDHNEFEGGFVVQDLGEDIRLATSSGYDEHHTPHEVLAVFHALVAAMEQ